MGQHEAPVVVVMAATCQTLAAAIQYDWAALAGFRGAESAYAGPGNQPRRLPCQLP
ncbi:conserved exported protein of unknown function [Ralstonia solanacearum PSI07]|uniref:Uncharacterized protein n=1 Tax=blood disease bacterium R229 TaxID=741978 RepID=G2ZVL9_9RALS|nr:conserved exported protein of unknown function [Ralstonia solanacearum PSI07]CCA83138.1 conserved exported hypothetical protein [blood disease bacterium R229]